MGTYGVSGGLDAPSPLAPLEKAVRRKKAGCPPSRFWREIEAGRGEIVGIPSPSTCGGLLGGVMAGAEGMSCLPRVGIPLVSFSLLPKLEGDLGALRGEICGIAFPLAWGVCVGGMTSQP